MSESNSPAVGIDLGTTFSAVAYLNADGRPETIANAEGDLTTPSVVFFDDAGVIVGKEAVLAGHSEAELLALFAKRDMGRSEFAKEIRGEKLPPEVMQALVLRKLKEDAELKLGSFEQAVITVPAFFNEPCRKATEDAARLAGIKVLDIINEPTAAAITYGVASGFLTETGESKQKETVLIYDLGGGTFDVTLMEIEGPNFRAMASAGDVYLGGADWDLRIAEFIAENFVAEYGVNPLDDPAGKEDLMEKANTAKHALTARASMNIFFNYQGHKLRQSISREQFESLTEDLVDRTLVTVKRVLTQAKKQWSDLTRLILVGGSTRMPMILDALQKEAGLEVDRSLSPDLAVAHGAAVYAGLLQKSPNVTKYGMSLTNVSAHDLGVLAIEPATGRKRRKIMIPRNTALPTSNTILFRTQIDGQADVQINVVEGGDDSGFNATEIGNCVVSDLPSELPKLSPVEVTFEYARNGRLRVHGRLPSAKREAAMEMNRATGISDVAFQKWKNRIDEGLSADSFKKAEPKTETTTRATGQTRKPVVKKVKRLSRPVKKTGAAPAVQVEPTQKSQPSPADVDSPVVIATGDTPKKQPSTPKKGDWKSRRKKINPGD